MKRHHYLTLLIVSLLTSFPVVAQVADRALMQSIYEEVKSPYKYGMVVAPQDTYHQIDCPTVYRENGVWYMTYVVYNGKGGLDGRGYETWMAKSDDLLHWTTLGRLLSYKDEGWDCNQRGGFPSLINWEWGGDYSMKTYHGKYWMTYIGGEGTGYEGVRAPLYIGQAWTSAGKPGAITTAHEWDTDEFPLLHTTDKGAQWWEKLIQYKSTIYEDKAKTLGKRFVMFYNAGGINPANNLKAERIGIALSNNMRSWKRYKGNPVFTHEAPGIITGDAQIVDFSNQMVNSKSLNGKLYVMFYFSAYSPERKYKAFNTFAVSRDLVNWQEWDGPDLVYPTKPYDEMFAHKSCVVKHDGVVYHFYCAVNNDNQRGIAVATSKPMGKSDVSFPAPDRKGKRIVTNLNDNWTSRLIDSNLKDSLPREGWGGSLPHNWDDYYGYRQLKHGNLHGTAVYKRNLDVVPAAGKRYFLQFEGIGTYATVILNNDTLCHRQPVGRTTYTLDITEQIKNSLPSREGRGGSSLPRKGQGGVLTVICHHPEMITDMPWVCGGCSAEWGFSEGSQPLGIYRPVSLIETDEVRIEPFGVHVWNNSSCDSIYVETEVKNYGSVFADFEVVNNINKADGKRALRLSSKVTLRPGESRIVTQQSPIIDVNRWSPADPYLYNVVSMIKRNGNTTDQVETPYGIRSIEWRLSPRPIRKGQGDGPGFYLNGERFFINGTCEYEHQLGGGHAFSAEQIASRIKMIRQAGFNAYREAHQPHNLLYQNLLDKEGMLFWSQFSAHVWYDTPQFRENFKTLLRQWINERRNSPSVILWGIQNESTMPKDFTEECAQIIREMDPMCSTSLEGRAGVGDGRLTTTCNGGEGSDWNVIQNWSGTYGGSALNYDNELKQPNQLLNGEYGAWRTLGLHSESPLDSLRKEKAYSEERATDLLETKVRLAEEAKDSVCGHFQWLFVTHDNPGRVQPDETIRMADKIGPVNYKGLMTVWEQPTDAFYMYRANYISPDEDPMVYIVSHTWADRFSKPRRTDINVYSNCDSVLLYNSADESVKLGRKKNARKPGTHMLWENRLVQYNVLRAVGYRGGKAVAEDVILLNNLPEAPGYAKLYEPSTVVPSAADNNKDVLKPQAGRNYVARINCGGDSYTDSYGNTWQGDNTRYSHSWGERFGNTDKEKIKASQTVIHEPIRGTRDWPLFQSMRYGRHELEYDLPLPDGKYAIEMYIAEPWIGTGGGISTDCEGERLFSVAVNGNIVLRNIDPWAEAGHAGALKRVVEAEAKNGHLVISFPETKVGQAIISAIAISTSDASVRPLADCSVPGFWAAIDADKVEKLPKELLPSEEEAFPSIRYNLQSLPSREGWSGSFTPGVAKEYALRFRYKSPDGAQQCQLRITDQKGTVLVDRPMTFPQTPKKFKTISTTTGTQINAGKYRVQLIGLKGVEFEYLEVQ